MNSRAFIIAAAGLLLLLAIPLIAIADSSSGSEGEFLARIQDESLRENRDFLVQSDDGFVAVSQVPGSTLEVGRLKHNDICYVFCTYNHNGEYWGYLLHDSRDSGKRIEGWARMDKLLAFYNRHEFYAEHQNDCYPYAGNYDELRNSGEVVLWAWPGSGVSEGILQDEVRGDAGFCIEETFRDEEGRQWGWFWLASEQEPYWICLSDPSNSALPGFVPEPFPWVGATSIGYNHDTY